MNDYLLGIDIGTTGAKVLLIDAGGRVRAVAFHEYPMFMPQPFWAEQNPADWWRAAVRGIRQVLSRGRIGPGRVAGVGLTGQMHGLVLLDRRGSVIRPCIMWNDQRTGAQCRTIIQKIGMTNLLKFTGNTVLPGFTAPKILWVRDHDSACYQRIAKFLLPKDYVRFMLTGGVLSDVADASGTGLFDVRNRRWSDEMFKALKLPQAWRPGVTESPAISGRVSRAGARATGLLAGTPVIGGAGDQAAQAIGAGVVDEPSVLVTIGTSGVVFAASRTFRSHPQGRLHAFCHAVPGVWHLMGVMLGAGGSLRWFRDSLTDPETRAARTRGRNVYDRITAAASKITPGSEGLIFLPYLTGERTPYTDPDARGVYFGLSLMHTRRHLARAVIEGVSYGLLDSFNLLRRLGVNVKKIRVSGGGARSAFWRQVIADVFNLEAVTVEVTEGAAYGAALLAGVGSGIFPDVPKAVRMTVKIRRINRPGPNRRIYPEYYRLYRSLYKALAQEFKKLARILDKPRVGMDAQ